ncbi:MAG: peptidyl-prolyl cis-trans isomerase [Thermodesulfobacteriota bacterium]
MERIMSASRMGKTKGLVYASLTVLCLTFANNGLAAAGEKTAAVAGSAARGTTKDQISGQESAKNIVVARVNGAEINMDSLVKMMNRISAKSKSGADRQSIEKQALERLILRNLAYQQAQSEGLKADEKNVTAAMENLRKNLGSEEEYEKFLALQQVSEAELKAQITRSLTLEIAYARQVYNKVSVPEGAVLEKYEQEKARYVTPEKMRVVDVLFLQQESDEAEQKTAEEVLSKIQAEKEQNAWKLSLDGTFIVRTYDINKDKDKELYKVGKKLKSGQLSGIIKTAKALHIIKMKEYRPERQLSLEEVRGNIENSLRVPAQDRRLQEWEQELRKEAKIEIVWPELAKKNS